MDVRLPLELGRTLLPVCSERRFYFHCEYTTGQVSIGQPQSTGRMLHRMSNIGDGLRSPVVIDVQGR